LHDAVHAEIVAGRQRHGEGRLPVAGVRMHTWTCLLSGRRTRQGRGLRRRPPPGRKRRHDREQ
jgi:hypothetical protein